MAELDLNTYRVPSFERAIPGQSLTDDPENPAPYEKPFQVSTLMDGINTLFLKITDEDSFPSILEAMKSKIPITDIAHYMLFEGFRKGIWNPDLMLLMAEPSIYMLIAFAERASIDYVLYDGEEEEIEELSEEERIEMNRKFSTIIENQIRNKNRVSSLPAEIQERIEDFKIQEEFKEKSLMDKTEESI